MAPIDLRLGQNAFQVIPELSLFDIEDGKFFGFFGLDQFVLAGTHVSGCDGRNGRLHSLDSHSDDR